jgi:hypothetical protein
MSDTKLKFNEQAMKELEDYAEVFVETLAEDISMTAKSICPVDTGALRDSIEVKDGEDKFEKGIGSDLEYALPVEVGHVTKKGTIVGPDSYLRPALEYIVSELNRSKGT